MKKLIRGNLILETALSALCTAGYLFKQKYKFLKNIQYETRRVCLCEEIQKCSSKQSI